MHHHDVLYFEKIVHRSDRLKSRKGTATRVRHGEQGPRVADPVAGFVENVFARIDLVPEIVGDSLRYFGCPRIKAVDHDGLHRDELIESLEGGPIEPGRVKPRLRPEFEFAVFGHLACSTLYGLCYEGSVRVLLSIPSIGLSNCRTNDVEPSISASNRRSAHSSNGAQSSTTGASTIVSGDRLCATREQMWNQCGYGCLQSTS